jgi:hypothetical protein
MDERQFYIERQETKNLTLVCPHCRQENSYPIRWMVRTKKKELPGGAGSEDRKRFANARSYMVRVDEMVACRNIRCRKRFELTGQSVVLTSESSTQQPGAKPGPDFDPETFGNR